MVTFVNVLNNIMIANIVFFFIDVLILKLFFNYCLLIRFLFLYQPLLTAFSATFHLSMAERLSFINTTIIYDKIDYLLEAALFFALYQSPFYLRKDSSLENRREEEM